MAYSSEENLSELLEAAFAEDIGSGDITCAAIIPEDELGEYAFTAREEMVFCGGEIIANAFDVAQPTILVDEGDRIAPGTVIAFVKGPVGEILSKERVVLNLIQHLSGVATETAKYVYATRETKAEILDTRKTIPLLRKLQKHAVICGGGKNHRMGLYDMVMIKDNHIDYAGGITKAVAKAKSTGKKIEVECDTIKQVHEALEAGADIIMADNMTPAQLREVVKIVNGKVPVEASGGVNLETVREIAQTGVDYISVGKLTHSVRAMDIGLDLV
jgi:nicotinate-nucleotide pyrophosphorylase (carboxylating)